jgi:hypothetical protein
VGCLHGLQRIIDKTANRPNSGSSNQVLSGILRVRRISPRCELLSLEVLVLRRSDKASLDILIALLEQRGAEIRGDVVAATAKEFSLGGLYGKKETRPAARPWLARLGAAQRIP